MRLNKLVFHVNDKLSFEVLSTSIGFSDVKSYNWGIESNSIGFMLLSVCGSSQISKSQIGNLEVLTLSFVMFFSAGLWLNELLKLDR